FIRCNDPHEGASLRRGWRLAAVPVGAAMDLETFITAVFCLADDFVRDLTRAGQLRRRGPEPVLADSEVLPIEAVGEFLGLDTDQALHAYFRRHFAELFPALRTVHRTTLARQGAHPVVVQGAVLHGVRLHLRVAWPVVITAATLAPANDADRAVAPQLLASLEGWALGDGGYWSPALRAALEPQSA